MKIRQNHSTLQLTNEGNKETKGSSHNQETKFDLYVQTRRVRQISAALDKIILNSPNTESLQLIQDQEFISEILDELLDDSILVLDGVQLDRESMGLSINLMSDIKKALGILEQVAENKREDLN